MAVSPPATSELTAARARALSPLSGATTRTLVLKESTAAWSFGPSAEIMLATAPLASVRGRPDMLPLVSTTNTSATGDDSDARVTVAPAGKLRVRSERY